MNVHIVHMENGRLASDTPHQHVQSLVQDALAQAGGGGLVFHFHGGLVSESSARGIAAKLTGPYLEAGAYPIFPVWESGLLETLRNNLSQVAGEAFFRIVLKLARKAVKRKFLQDDGARSAGVLPPVQEEVGIPTADMAAPAGLTELSAAEQMTLEVEFQQSVELVMAVNGISAGLRDPADVAADVASRSVQPVVASEDTLMDPEAVERLVERTEPDSRGLISTLKASKSVVKIVISVLRRYISGRDHGLHATLVEEILREYYLANIGGKIWEAMKQDTADSFGPDPQVFGGTALLTELANSGVAAPPKITLIGHSTGAVYISHWIKAAEEILPNDWKFNVIFLAPASTCELTADTIDTLPDRISGFRMFTMTDQNEKNDRLVPFLYPLSLLYFVSGVVEPEADTPIVGMQRYFDPGHYPVGQFPNVETVRQYIGSTPGGVAWSVVDQQDGHRTSAVRHGDFDDNPLTVASVQHILQHGY